MPQKYDAIVIGAGMSGLATAIRLSMYQKKVCLVEKHSISGGLNSYYRRGKREFDVGLHALTNFVAKGSRGAPLIKMLKQLRIPYDALKLQEQNYSEIRFPSEHLKFSNDFELFRQEIAQKFPQEIDGFVKLVAAIEEFDETNLDNRFQLSREVIGQYIQSEQLIEMILCPLLIYGSAWENDMDFSQFVIMFKSIYLEGFSRPEGGVRTIINLLLDKLKHSSCDVRFKTGISKILQKDDKAYGVVTESGEEIIADQVFSSAGWPETCDLIKEDSHDPAAIGKLSFTESIIMSDHFAKDSSVEATIIFYNENDKYSYRKPNELADSSSAVICFPNNFVGQTAYEEEVMRVTYMANYEMWRAMERKEYLSQKQRVFETSLETCKKVLPGYDGQFNFKDVFTPTTITRYTSHLSGTVYGSTHKKRRGETPINGLYLIGTDQGFLGIIGSLLSGISMANLHGLMESK